MRKVRGVVDEKGYEAATLSEILDGFGGSHSSWHVTNGIGEQIVQDLMRERVVILGLRNEKYPTGHIVIVYGVTYVKNYYSNRTYIDQVWVWDPNVGKGFRVISGCKVKDELEFAIHLQVLG